MREDNVDELIKSMIKAELIICFVNKWYIRAVSNKM
jgi:hypothetical protein